MRSSCLLVFLASLTACSTTTISTVDAIVPEPDLTPTIVPGVDTTVSAFDQKPVYFIPGDNQRTVNVAAAFPTEGAYQSINLHIALSCPNKGCDVWDRLSTIGVVTKKGTDGGPDTVVEVARFVTPFGIGASWDLDITDLRPLLSGTVTIRGFIDTWVGPSSQYGEGWRLTARNDMNGGIPTRLPIAVLPVWQQRAVIYGDPGKPIANSIAPALVTLPAASSYALCTFLLPDMAKATSATVRSSARAPTRSPQERHRTHARSGAPIAKRPLYRDRMAPTSTRALAGVRAPT